MKIKFILYVCAVLFGAVLMLCPIFGAESPVITNKQIEMEKKSSNKLKPDIITSKGVITNKDIEKIRQKKQGVPIKKTSQPSQKKSNNKSSASVKTASKQETKKDPKISPKSTKKTEPFVKIESSDSSINIVVKGDPPKKEEKQLEESLVDYTLPRTLRASEKLLPFEDWEGEYSEYFEIHYDDPDVYLKSPSLISIRALKAPSVGTLFDMYERGSLYDEGDDGPVYGHLSSHFVIDTNGMIIRAMPLDMKTRGCEGVEHRAFTVDLVGTSAQQFEFNDYQREALVDLLKELCLKFKIEPSKIYSQTEVASGKKVVPEYLDLNDSEYPDSYSPKKNPYGPSKKYIEQIRSIVKDKLQIKKGSEKKK